MHKNECFFTCFPITRAQDSPRRWNSPSKRRQCKENEARRGEIERQRAERGITEKALERDGERWEEGGLCTSLLLLALLFLNGLVLLVGRLITRALRLKWSRAAFAWASLLFLFFYFKMVISVLGVRTGERLRGRMRDNTREKEREGESVGEGELKENTR